MADFDRQKLFAQPPEEDRLWNETPIGGPFSQAGRDFMWQFTPMGFMEGFGQGVSQIFPKPEWYR